MCFERGVSLPRLLECEHWGYAMTVLIGCGAGVVGGLLFGAFHVTLEHVWFYLLRFLESRNIIKRLAPSIQVTTMKFKMEDFWSVSISPMPLAALMFAGRQRYLQNCHFALDLIGGLQFTWVVMVLHDAYFWGIHTLFHKLKPLYRRIHQLHHSTNGDITVFSTAYGNILDIAFSFTPFYAAVMLWMYHEPKWNPFHLVLATWAVNNVDMMGHCGYSLPAWVFAPASLGVLLTPLSQKPLHHYIHHLDPRFNRSLYFTWCDRIAGTYKDFHPKITD